MVKSTKSSSEFDAGESFKLKSSYNELAIWKVIWIEGLKVGDSASCYYTFPGGAVFFTACYILSWSIRLGKNKALGEFFRLK